MLGGLAVRQQNFRRNISPLTVQVDGVAVYFNVDKNGFWGKCGHLIEVAIRHWKDRYCLTSGDHVWLRVSEPFRRFKLEI